MRKWTYVKPVPPIPRPHTKLYRTNDTAIRQFFGDKAATYYNTYGSIHKNQAQMKRKPNTMIFTYPKRQRITANNPYSNMPRVNRQRAVIVPVPPVPRSSYNQASQENKYVDSGYVALKPKLTSAPAGYEFTNMVEGSGGFNRNGRKVILKGYGINLAFIKDTSVVTGTMWSNTYRMIVVYDRQANGAAPSWADVFLEVKNDGTTFGGFFSGINQNNRERFTILEDRFISVPQFTIQNANEFGSAAYGPNSQMEISGNTAVNRPAAIKEWRKLPNYETVYKANAGTMADVTTGSLFFWLVAEHVNGSADSTGLMAECSFRLKFIDP